MSPTNKAGRRRAARGAAIALLAALAMHGAAGAMTIAPVVVELSPVRKVVSITVTNPSDTVVNFQAEVLAWSQADGRDRFEATRDLMVVPPVARIAAGGTQIFRVTSRIPSGAREQAYRLILEDVSAEMAGPEGTATVNIRVRHSLPVFVAANGTPAISLQLTQCVAPAGKACVRLSNDGGRYITAKSLTVAAGSWSQDVALSTRLLVGGWREWQFDVPAKVAGIMNVKADTSAGTFDGTLSTASR
jgi:fimbrial chaperone protein